MRLIPFLFCFGMVSSIFGQTQVEMNREALKNFELADSLLKITYQELLHTYQEDSSFLSALKDSQRSWITFRDSMLKMKYPSRPIGWYGSNHSMCLLIYKKELTTARNKTLQEWLTGDAEGDACAGSTK